MKYKPYPTSILVISLMAVATFASAARGDARTDLLKKVGIDQHIGAQIPADLKFTNEEGQTVTLGQYFKGDRPMVLSLVYFRCPMLCTTVLNELNVSMNTMPPGYDIGREYDVLTVSFNPEDTWQLAADKRHNYIRQYGRPTAEQGWHFLTGDQASIDALTKAVGFRYVRDPSPYRGGGNYGAAGAFINRPQDGVGTGSQFIHAGGIMVLTPSGKVSKYFYGINYAPKDLRLALTEAKQEKSGSLTDAVLLFCFHYDEHTGKYTVAVMRILRVFGALLLVVIGFFWTRAVLRERRAAAAAKGFHPAVPPGLG
jgi:protein SCO1